ncbi:UDP-N-acetylmuramoyl-L-alanine--D-glutamate ligase [bacterium]|nr:UDP-N-acetylmuramoyl-L-alanine--D-glutamate ligase [bacterium]
MYENKKILILGAAKSGIAVAKLLANKNNDITLCDLNDLDEKVKNELESLNIKIIITKNQIDLIDESYDLIVKNPAIASVSPLIKKCHELNLRVENEMEVAYHYLPKNVKIIGVTGSNGKTTTTTIIYEMLKCCGFSVKLGGNIGYPLAEILPTIKENDIVLLEISDHQLCDLNSFKTDISVLTNICPTHLDYHGTYEAYKNTKRKIFNNHTSNDIAIINLENEDALEESKDIPSKKLYFSSKNKTNAYLNNGNIIVNDKVVINIKDIKLKGIHNYENILAAYLVLSNFTMDFENAVSFLKNFGGVEHRMEYVTKVNGVEYYNDSKSTNPTATITALKTFDSPINLILGGKDRNQDYHELDEYMSNVKKIYAIGQTTDKVYEYAKELNIPCSKDYTLKEALKNIKREALENDIVLLSPGAASQDQYKRFEDRGKEFKENI